MNKVTKTNTTRKRAESEKNTQGKKIPKDSIPTVQNKPLVTRVPALKSNLISETNSTTTIPSFSARGNDKYLGSVVYITPEGNSIHVHESQLEKLIPQSKNKKDKKDKEDKKEKKAGKKSFFAKKKNKQPSKIESKERVESKKSEAPHSLEEALELMTLADLKVLFRNDTLPYVKKWKMEYQATFGEMKQGISVNISKMDHQEILGILTNINEPGLFPESAMNMLAETISSVSGKLETYEYETEAEKQQIKQEVLNNIAKTAVMYQISTVIGMDRMNIYKAIHKAIFSNDSNNANLFHRVLLQRACGRAGVDLPE